MSKRRFRTFFVLPVSLLLLNALEEVAVYQVKRHVANPYVVTVIFVLMFAAGFAIVGEFIAPFLKSLLESGRKTAKKQVGNVGLLVSYGLAIALVFIMYHVIHTRGPEYLLPLAWR